MRNVKSFRYFLVGSTLVALAAAGAVACGDDDPDPGTTPGVDGGNRVDGSTNPDGGPSGDDSGAEGGPSSQPAKILVIHAGTDFGSANPAGGVRICFGTATAAAPTEFAVAPTPAYPNTAAGLPLGAGGPMASTGLSLASIVIQPYLMNAKSLADRGLVGATAPTCEKLLAANLAADGGALVENTDFWKLPAIPAQSLLDNKTYALAVTGCVQNTSVPFGDVQEICGADFNTGLGNAAGLGNLKARLFELDTTAPAAGEIGAQALLLSPSYGAGPGSVAPALVAAGDGGADAAAPAPRSLVGQGQTSTFPPTAATPRHVVTGGVLPGDSLTPSPASPVFAHVPLAAVAQLSGGAQVANGKNHLFVFVGNLAEDDLPDGGFNPKSFHPLAFPTDFTPGSF